MERLEDLVKEASGEALPPVESWNPPHCGDIGMEIRADGTWFYQKSPIGREKLVKLFSRILRRDADGHHYLVTPVEKVIVHVADAPFLAVEMEVSGEGREQTLIFRTNVGDVVRCGRDHPMRFEIDARGGGLKPYIRVRGRLDALVNRSVYFDLMALACPEGDASGPPGLWSCGIFFPLTSHFEGEVDAPQA